MLGRLALHGGDLDTGRAVLKAAFRVLEQPAGKAGDQAAPVRGFVTISRQPGAGAFALAQYLAERLNLDGGDWTAWDHELIDKVSADLK